MPQQEEPIRHTTNEYGDHVFEDPHGNMATVEMETWIKIDSVGFYMNRPARGAVVTPNGTCKLSGSRAGELKGGIHRRSVPLPPFGIISISISDELVAPKGWIESFCPNPQKERSPIDDLLSGLDSPQTPPAAQPKPRQQQRRQ